MADGKSGAKAQALMEVAKMVNELRNAVVLTGLIVGAKHGGAEGETAASNARSALERIAKSEKLLQP